MTYIVKFFGGSGGVVSFVIKLISKEMSRA